MNISATASEDNSSLKIDGTTYYCYLYSDSTFSKDGEENFFGSSQLLLKNTASKVDDITDGDIFAIGGYKEFCEDLY